MSKVHAKRRGNRAFKNIFIKYEKKQGKCEWITTSEELNP